jgi:hypothetical protein
LFNALRLLAAAVPSRGVAGVGIDLARGVIPSASIGQAAGRCEISWLGRFAVAHSEIFCVAHSAAYARLLAVGGAARPLPMAVSGDAPILGEHRCGNGGEKKSYDAKRFDFGHLSISGLI